MDKTATRDSTGGGRHGWHEWQHCGLPLPRVLLSLIGIVLGVLPAAAPAATYWQLQNPDFTAIVEGDPQTAKAVGTMTLRLRSAARWLLGWPDSYHEPPVLVFVVDESFLRRMFRFPPDAPGAYTDANSGHESWARTQALSIVAVPKGYQHGHELRSLQHAYAEVLLDAPPTQDWPACAHLGMAVLFAAAELTSPNHIYLPGEQLLREVHLSNPEEVLLPKSQSPGRLPQWAADERGYSCYFLSFMMASGEADERRAMGRMLAAVGNGAPFAAATVSELRETAPEFTARFRERYRSLQLFPNRYDLRIDVPEAIPDLSEPEPISGERVGALLSTLCTKLQNCRK